MDRHRYRESIELVAHTVATLPVPFQRLLQGADFLCDYDPAFVGLISKGEMYDGRDPGQTSQVVYPFSEKMLEPKSRRRTTAVLHRRHYYRSQMGLIILHEIGHVIHQMLGFPRPFVALDSYAARNSHEAFATSFQSFLSNEPWMESKFYHTVDVMRERDPLGYYFFSRVAKNKHINFRVM